MWGSFLYAGISLPPRRQKANFVGELIVKNDSKKIKGLISQDYLLKIIPTNVKAEMKPD